MAARISFTEEPDGSISAATLDADVYTGPPTVRHPAPLDKALHALPGHGSCPVTRLTAAYNVIRQTNTVSYSIVTDLTGPARGCPVRATGRCDEEAGHLERIAASAEITLPVHGPEEA
ncbi:hypothetical protein, partial [Streptomyces lavendulae]|uniref:hypothetical protein n=1 Tax=Streptomyces lavendulae TaxID=1914 RepID=UPI0036EA7B14